MPAHGFYIRHVKRIEIKDVEIRPMQPDMRPGFVLEDVSGAELIHVKLPQTPEVPSVVLKNVKDFSVTQSKPLAGYASGKRGAENAVTAGLRAGSVPEAPELQPCGKSLAGVAANTRPFAVTRLACAVTARQRRSCPPSQPTPAPSPPRSTSPPRLLPGVGFALRSADQRARYSSYHASRGSARAPPRRLAARGVSRCTASRTSVTSENITVAPARTSRSAA